MKYLFFLITACFLTTAINAQEPTPAKPGVVYGIYTDNGLVPVNVNEIEAKFIENKYEGQVKGKVVEVCKAMGCWAKLEKADGTTVMIKVKDHEFAMPLDIVGKTIVADGVAEVKETSVSMLKHYAEDAGKSDEEIKKITKPQKEVIMTIKGVKVVG